jgi:ATP-binding cassette subfamily B protein
MNRAFTPRIGKRQHLRLVGQALGIVWAGGRGWTVASFALLVVRGLLPLAALYLLKVLLDQVAAALTQPGAAVASVLWTVLALAGVAALEAAGRALAGLVAEAQSMAVTDHVQAMLHAKSVAVDLAYYETPRYYDTFHRAQAEGSFRPTQIAQALVQLLQNGLSLAGVAALVIAFDFRIAIILVLAVAPGLWVRVVYARRLHRLHGEHTPSERKARYIDWVLGGDRHAKEVRLFELGPELLRRFAELRRRLRQERQSLSLRSALADFGTQIFAVAAIYGALAYLVVLTFAGRLTVGGLVMYHQAFQRAQGFLSSLLQALASLYEANLYLANLYEFLELEPRVHDPAAPVPVPRPWTAGIECRDVSFRYAEDEPLALDGVSLSIPPGQVVALVGENGSGKTTLIKLLCRLYDPDAGQILLDGQPLSRYAQADLRRHITVVFQDYARFRLTARENIRFGNLLRPDHEAGVPAAARASGADRVVAHLPAGYDTQLGRWFNEGHELSQGQWQKLALARALYRDAQLIVLDEPTSAMDARAEAAFFEGFRAILGRRCAILISHRFSTVRLADHIVVLDGGKLVEQGSHDELVGADGSYAALYGLQARGYR